METEQVDLRSFVARCVSGEKQNDSVDSGVCPSPAEGFQNYDEAFPPLSAFADDGELNLVVSSWQSTKRPADPSVYSFAPSPITILDNSSIIDPSSSPIQTGATPIKRPKLQPLNDITNRPLRSCPDLPSQKSFSNPNGAVTFCCPMVNALSTNGIGVKTARASPQFVVPKCFKVGSWPSRSGKGCKYANDVPFWSCTEWFCTVHKSVEFGLLSAKVGSDAAKNLAPQTNITQINAPSIQKDAAAPITLGSGCPSLSDGMFDAPRFILHIINENDNVENEFGSMADFVDDEKKYNEANRDALNVDTYDWTMTSQAGLAEFTFMPYHNSNLQPNVSSSFPPQEVGFCLPKFDLPSVEQQCKIQSSCNASPFSKLTELQLQQQQMTSNHSSYCNLNVSNNEQPANQQTNGVGISTTTQTVAVPISPNTHFVPIRSESMEDAYYPKPGFDESFGSLVDETDYHVYRDRDETRPFYCDEHSRLGDRKEDRQKKKIPKRSLPLKFKASLPNKLIQTDLDVDGQVADDEMSRSLDADFEIWACKPVSISGSLLSSIEWPENFDGQLIVGPFSSFTWGDRQVQCRGESPMMPTIVVAGQKPKEAGVERLPPPVGHATPNDELQRWQRQDERDEDMLLQFVSNISLISPLDSTATSSAIL